MSLRRAPAKLTWFLEMTGRRADGYHLLRSEMRTLALADDLDIEPADDTSLVIDGPFADGLSTTDNLVLRALAVAGRRARVRLTKNIPHGGGLGGGSADAAAILRWAGITDPALAASLGADVPFCVMGGRALVTGVGELLEPLDVVREPVSIVVPPFSLSTAAVYRRFDELGEAGNGRNHLRVAAESVEPRLQQLRAWWRAEFGRDLELCGSGATCFYEGHAGLTATVSTPVGDVTVYETETV
jgi:4-diphosphocytidyl-2-C-methyl-D-erythritol kinase